MDGMVRVSRHGKCALCTAWICKARRWEEKWAFAVSQVSVEPVATRNLFENIDQDLLLLVGNSCSLQFACVRQFISRPFRFCVSTIMQTWCTTYSSGKSSRSCCHDCSGSTPCASSSTLTVATRGGIQPPATRDMWCCLPSPAAGPSRSQFNHLRVDCLASYCLAASAILLTVLFS